MKNIVTLMMGLCCSISLSWAQLSPLSSTGYSTEAPVGYWLELEATTSHSGGVLDGQTTYRLYLNTLNSNDFLSSCSGDQDNVMIISSSTGTWYNDVANTGWNALGINPVFYAFFPELAFDSYLTIGAEDATFPAAQHPSTVWGDVDASEAFVPGPGFNIVVDDATGGAWYSTFPGLDAADSHAAFAGVDNRVLVAQITTAGDITGQFQVQVFVNGDQADEFRDVLPICLTGECGGCTDESASNYDADALYDDDSCEYAIQGCTDVTACNFDEEATEDDGTCVGPIEGFNCDGECILDVDCAGECGGNATEDALGVCGGDCPADINENGICDTEEDCLGTIDECGVCDGPGAIYECGCSDIPEGECDCDGNVIDDCGICGGPGAIYECGCFELTAGTCDCDGNQLDAIGVCGGDCSADSDADGICDDIDECIDVNQNGTCDEDETGEDCFHDSDGDGIVDCEDTCPFGDFDDDGICDVDDPCVGQVDILGICNGHCFFNDDGDMICDDVDNCIDTDACNFNDPANGECLYSDDCGVCGGDNSSCTGCTDAGACNYDETATIDDGCEYITCAGCADAEACNYEGATIDDGSCVYEDECGICDGPGAIYECGCSDIPEGDCDCDGSVIDQCGVCGGDGQSCVGCADETACNYDGATIDDGSCIYEDECGICGGPGAIYECGCSDIPEGDCDCEGNVLDLCGDCGGDNSACTGCTDPLACNYIDDSFIIDDGSCLYLDCEGTCGGSIFVEDCAFDVEGTLHNKVIQVLDDCDSGLDNTFVDGGEVVLDPNGNIVQYANGTQVIVGFWTFDACACAAGNDPLGLQFYALSCDEFQFSVDSDGQISQSDAEACDCVEFVDLTDYFCSDDFFDSLSAEEVVQCDEDLPTGCDEEFSFVDTCSDDILVCAFNDAADSYTTYDVVTAMGPGADAAVRLYGLSAQTDCLSDYFIEDEGQPLTLTVLDNGTAVLTGVVRAPEPQGDIAYEVYMQFEAGMSAQAFLDDNPAHSLLIAGEMVNGAWETCDIDAEEMQVFTMVNTLSRLTRLGGSYDGETLFLNHMPASTNKRFQLGEGANNHNCNDGFGGWFGWEGVFNGEEVAGFSGDVIADIDNEIVFDTQCTGAFTVETYGAFNVEENSVEIVSVTTTVDDTIAPEFSDCPADVTLEFSDAFVCGTDGFDAILAAINDSIPVSCLATSDNCANWDPMYEGCNEGSCGTVTFEQGAIDLGFCGFEVRRTWVATDAYGNATECQQTITVFDTEDPIITALPEVTIDACDINTWMASADDCGSGIESFTFTQFLQSGGCDGILDRVYTAVDSCGHVTTFGQIVYLEDTDAPSVFGEETFLDCGEYDPAAYYPLMVTDCSLLDWTPGPLDQDDWVSTPNGEFSTVYDEIDSEVEVSWSDALPEHLEGDTCYRVERTVTAVDRCGNETIETYQLNIYDNVAPEISATPVLNIECSDYLGDSSTGAQYVVTDADNGIGFYEGAPVGIWEGQTSFQVEDDCTFDALFADGGGQVIVTWIDVQIGEGCGSNATYERTYTAHDVCGNSASTTQTVIITDLTAPVWVNEAGEALSANETILHLPCEQADSAQMNSIDHESLFMAADLCDANLDYSVSAVHFSGGCIGAWIRTWTATDDCGNSTDFEQTVVMYDNGNPFFTSFPADVTISLDSGCSANFVVSATGGEPEAADNCDACFDQNLTITYADVRVLDCGEVVEAIDGGGSITEYPGSSTVTRTWTVTDQCGNSTSQDQIISLIDDTAPNGFASTPDVDCTEYSSNPQQMFGTIDLGDNCDANIDVTFDAAEDSLVSHNSENGVPAGCYTLRRTFTLTDDCGNASTVMQTINVVDNTPPVYQGPGEISIPAEEYDVEGAYPPDVVWAYSTDSEWESFPIGYIDDCSPLFSCTAMDLPLSGGCADQPHPEYPMTESATWLRVLTITDLCGNTSTAEVIINLIDDDAPVFDFVPADYTVACVEDTVMLHPEYSDLVDENLLLEYEEVMDMTCPNQFTLTRTWTITDNCDNETEATQVITVQDDIAPAFTFVPEDYTVECYGDIMTEMATASDNCTSGASVAYIDSETQDASCPGNWEVLRTFIATDACGNSTSVVQTITVLDTTAPEITCSEDRTVECSLIESVGQNEIVAPLAAITQNNVFGTYPSFNPNRFTGTFVYVSAGLVDALPGLFEAGDKIGLTRINGQSVQRTITSVTGVANQPSTRRVNFGGALVSNNNNPNYNLGVSENSDIALIELTPVQADNCGIMSLEESIETAADCNPTYTVTRTYTTMDTGCNTTSCTQTIHVVDTTNPVISAQAQDVSYECTGHDYEASNSELLDDWLTNNGGATATDNCGAITWSHDYEVGDLSDDCGSTGSVEVIFTATDDCGNSSTTAATYTIVDTEVPMLAGTPTNNNGSLSVPYDSYCGEVTVPAIADVSATDVCSSAAVCDSAANADANAGIAEVLGGDILGADGHLDLLTSVTTSGVNNPFVTGGEHTIGGISTPATLLDGETCDNNANQHGMRMFNFEGGEYYITEAGFMTKNHIDGTATISMTVSNDLGAFDVEATFGTLLNWEEWCETPGLESYKSDCGLGDHMTWDYAILLDGSITGVAGTAFEGTALSMSHQPANEYFGFQFGVGANNKNANYGFSGWYYYSGALVINGEESSAMGSGDLFGDLDFLQPWATTFLFCAVDECGNDVTYTYSFTSTGELQDPLLEGGVEGEQDTEPAPVKDLIEITTLYPNPASTQAMLTVTVKEDVTAKVQIFTMDGSLVDHVFEGQMYEGWPTTLELNINNLESGMYQVRVSSKDFVTTKKLLVIE